MHVGQRSLAGFANATGRADGINDVRFRHFVLRVAETVMMNMTDIH
jgi:hypothetical protein